MASPPFTISETLPLDSDLISNFPGQEHPFRDTVESWLTFLSDPTTGLLKPTAFAFPFVITNAAAGVFFTLESTDGGAASGPSFELYRNSGSPAVSDALGALLFYGKDSAANKQLYASIYPIIADPVSGTEDSQLNFSIQIAGVDTLVASINPAGFNVSGAIGASGAIAGAAISGTTGTFSSSISATAGTFSTGNVVATAGDFVTSGGAGAFVGNTGGGVILAPGVAGACFLRPNGKSSAVGQTTVSASGDVAIAGNTTVAGGIASTALVFANTAAGTMHFRPNGIASASAEMTYTAAGTLTAAGDITAFSDRRMKKSISSLNHEWANDMVRAVNPKTYIRKSTDTRGIGFIAQDVQAYAPEVVHENEHGILSLAYPNMVAILWAVVQDLQAKVAELEAK